MTCPSTRRAISRMETGVGLQEGVRPDSLWPESRF
jgi:hypothetical protein